MPRTAVVTRITDGVLRMEDAIGRVLIEATPNRVVSIGNSLGGYLVAPLNGSPQKWGFWRLSGGEKLRVTASGELPEGVTLNGGRYVRPADQNLLDRVLRRRPEAVAVAGRWYLLATSSGSARNGVLHRFVPSTDSVEAAAFAAGFDKNSFIEVALDKAVLQVGEIAACYGQEAVTWRGDGGCKLVHKWTGSRGEVGNLDLVHPDQDTTFVVTWCDRVGFGSACGAFSHRLTVATRPAADRKAVAAAISEMAELSRLLRMQEARGYEGKCL